MKLKELLNLMTEIAETNGISKAFLCGGTPRDRYLNRLKNLSDLDITTGDKSVGFLAQEAAQVLSKKYNIKQKTMQDGHSSIFLGNIKLDFSSNFNAPNIEQHLSKLGVTNPTDIQQEMFSRDFTCNALLLDFDLKTVLDPTKRGFKDLDNKIIRTCLPPEITLTSNKNRVIRAIYLACKLDFEVDNDIVTYVKVNPETINISSTKSLKDKLTEAFEYNADKASDLITQMGLWNYIPIVDAAYPYYIKYGKGKSNVIK